MNWLRVTTIAVLLALGACRAREGGPPFVIRDSAGIRVVENDHTQSAWGAAGAWSLAPQPRLQMGNNPGDMGHQLYRVSHSVRLSSGPIAIANTGLADVRVFDEGGFLLRTMRVTAVEQPDQIAPIKVYELAGDSLLVFLTDRTLAVFDAQGRLTRRTQPVAIDVQSDPAPELMGILRDGSLVFRAFPPADTSGTEVVQTYAELLRYRSDGSPIGSIGRFPSLLVLPGAEALVFAPEGLQALGDSTIWYGSGDGYELREVSITGAVKQVVRLDRPPNRVTAVDTIGYRRAAVRALSESIEGTAAERLVQAYRFQQNFPAYSEMVIDRVGNIWLKGYHWYDLGAPVTWTVFDREGRFLGDLVMPSLMEVHDIGDRYVLGRMAAERVEAVFMYEINKPGSTEPMRAGAGGIAP
jgi:hypothetical protein